MYQILPPQDLSEGIHSFLLFHNNIVEDVLVHNLPAAYFNHLNLFITCLNDSNIRYYKHVALFWFREDYTKVGGTDNENSVSGDNGNSIITVDPMPNAGFDFLTWYHQTINFPPALR